MIDHQALGALAGTHTLLLQLVEDLPARDCRRRFDPALPTAGWLLGRAVYLELHLLRGVVMQDDDLAARVRHLFDHDQTVAASGDAALPPQDHLLNWAHEIFDQDLTWLANPGYLPSHPLLREGWLVWHLAQRQALLYERLLAVLTARSALGDRSDYRVTEVLQARLPRDDSSRIEQGHYRVGARDGAVMANEQPPQAVELHAFRISRSPVGNAEYLAFIDDGGYRDLGWWDEAGVRWRESNPVDSPWHWYRDQAGHWYNIGINGPMDLHPDEPVTGLSAHEARAFAAWASARGTGLAGAVPQHEYQWEVAARLGEIERIGRSWEWCANAFHAYPNYREPVYPALEPCLAQGETTVLRGGCLHTQPTLRRSTFRLCAPAARRELFAGTRLVMPAGKAAWE
jgi:iron(II)-dependent oxidoreductase